MFCTKGSFQQFLKWCRNDSGRHAYCEGRNIWPGDVTHEIHVSTKISIFSFFAIILKIQTIYFDFAFAFIVPIIIFFKQKNHEFIGLSRMR